MTDVSRVDEKTGQARILAPGALIDRVGTLLLQASLPLGLSALFLWDGLAHYVLNFPVTVAHLRAVGLSPPETLCALAGAFVIVGALAILTPVGRRFGALTLAAYTGLAALSPHGVMSLAQGLGIEPRGAADFALVAVLLLVALPRDEDEA